MLITNDSESEKRSSGNESPLPSRIRLLTNSSTRFDRLGQFHRFEGRNASAPVSIPAEDPGMTLLSCLECEHDVSSTANACPNCGAPPVGTRRLPVPVPEAPAAKPETAKPSPKATPGLSGEAISFLLIAAAGAIWLAFTWPAATGSIKGQPLYIWPWLVLGIGLVGVGRSPQLRPKIVCKFCGASGCVSAAPVERKRGISGGKATGAILTGGLSLFATGLSRKETVTQLSCKNCDMKWDA